MDNIRRKVNQIQNQLDLVALHAHEYQYFYSLLYHEYKWIQSLNHLSNKSKTVDETKDLQVEVLIDTEEAI